MALVLLLPVSWEEVVNLLGSETAASSLVEFLLVLTSSNVDSFRPYFAVVTIAMSEVVAV